MATSTTALKMKKELAIFTNTYPYGTGETFLADEAPYVFAGWEKVHIFPMYIPQGDDGETMRRMPANAVLHKPLLKGDHKDRRSLLLGGIFSFAPIGFAIREFVGKKIYADSRKCWIWGNYLCILRSILRNGERMREVTGVLEGCRTAYFYWGDKSALAIPFLKRKMGAKAPVFAVRFHGSDIYEEAKGYLPFREMLYGAIDHAVPVSQNGREYIETRYKNQPGNIAVHRLGSFWHSDACPNLGAPVPDREGEPDSTGAYNIISCSNVIELKRVHLLAAAMLHLERNRELAETLRKKGVSHICWTHIGDGTLLEPIKEMVVQNGVPEGEEGIVPVAFNFKGAMPHEKVMEHYQTHYTDLFINVSRSEGIPVSIMEALSYGTPVLATDVGAVRELIPEGSICGKLLKKEITAEELAGEIAGWIFRSLEMPEFELALAARKEWEENWNGRKNYAGFAAWLESLR